MPLFTRGRTVWRSFTPDLRGEYIMALNRITFGILMIFVTGLLGDALPFAKWAPSILLWVAGSIGLLVFLVCLPRVTILRRCLALAFDVAGTTILLLAGGQATAFLYVVYHWIIIGNGFRFGGKYTVAGSIVSIAGFAVVIEADPFWRDHHSLSLGLLSGLVVLPAYTFVLIRQLTKARQQAERADQAKSLFLASISHELRTPLNAIVGTAELLRATRLDKLQAEMVATINTAADGQLSLIQDVLAFSSMEAGQGRIQATDFDLVVLFANVRAVIGPSARKKGLLLNSYITARTPLQLNGDERRIREVLLNICSNAVKFTSGGSITLAVDGLDIGGGLIRLRFEVMDTGIGIKPEAQAHIFKLFTQADETVLDRFGGTGLGLALCDLQVRLMGGAIGVESLPNAGSTFWITLDVAGASAAEPACLPARLIAVSNDPDWRQARLARLAPFDTRSQEVPSIAVVQAGSEDLVPAGTDALIEVVQGTTERLPSRQVREVFSTTLSWSSTPEDWQRAVRIAAANCTVVTRDFTIQLETERQLADAGKLAGLRVLVADDNGINRSIVARMLEQSGIEAVFASDGEEALSILTDEGVDIALLDVNMPVMNGIETAKLYNFAMLGGRRTPLIALTADATPVTRQRCLQAGMETCLVKPVRTADLLKALANAAPVREAQKPVPRPAVAPSTPPLNEATLAALDDLGGAEFTAKLITEFERDGALILDDIEIACLVPDLHGFRAAAHSFASISANMGASRVGELCLRLQNLPEGDFKSMRVDLLDQLHEAWSETCIAFERSSAGRTDLRHWQKRSA